MEEKYLNNLKRMYEVHLAMLLRLAQGIVRRREDAEDVVHDAFVRLMKTYRSLPPADDPRAARLCRVVTVSCAIDLLRRRNREVLTEEESCFEQPHSLRGDGTLSDSERVGRILASMSPGRQRIFLLRYEDELSVNEIAGLLGMTPNAVSQELSRGRKKIKEALKGGGL